MDKLEKYIEIIKKGGVGAVATDTIWGMVGSIFSEKAVKRLYHLKKREDKKPLIFLISDIKQLKEIDIFLSEKELEILKKIWPSKISIVLPQKKTKKFNYLYKIKNTISVRFPKKKLIQKLVKKTRPIFASSANIHKKPVAKNISEVKKYFKDNLDFIISGRVPKDNLPSSLISIDFKNKIITIMRKGADFNKLLKFKKLGFKIKNK